MINENKKKLSNTANTAIQEAMEARIPFYRAIAADDHPQYVCQSDLYGYVDTIIQIGGEKLYYNNNKSRSDNREDICIECRSFRGKPENLNTGEPAPIAGAYWSNAFSRWISPRFGQADTLTIYLPKINYVGHYSRYFLEIMLSKEETWERISGMFKESSDCDTIIAFWHYRTFTDLYLQTVRDVTGNLD